MRISKPHDRSPNFHLYFRDHHGQPKRMVAFPSFERSEALADIVKTLVEHASTGQELGAHTKAKVRGLSAQLKEKLASLDLIPGEVTLCDEPLDRVIVKWGIWLEGSSRGGRGRYAENSMQQVARVAEGCGWKTLGDLSAYAAEAWIERSEFTKATKTNYAGALKRFGRWLRRHTNSPEGNPFEDMKTRYSGHSMKRTRALTKLDLECLLAAAEFHIEGSRLHDLYTFAAFTGFRSAEIASLTYSSLDYENSTVTLSGEHSKNGKPFVMPMDPRLFSQLFPSSERKPDSSPLFHVPCRVSDTMKSDCLLAKIKVEDEESRVVFHSLRKTFISNLVASNVHPKVIQTLARHSSITTTMDVYAEVTQDAKQNAILSLYSAKEVDCPYGSA